MVFCSQCGAQGQGRFCSQCGSPLSDGSSGPSPTSSNTSGVNWGTPHRPSQPAAPAQPQESFTALIGSQGQLMPAFYHIASELFIKLDQSVEPKGTRGLEPKKIVEFKKMGGKTVSKYFESHVLPMYYDVIGAERVPNLPSAVLTWDGWHTYLHHKVLAMPSDTFTHLLAVFRALGIQLPHPLTRGDLPLHPDPEAAAREQKFQIDIRQLASMAMRVQSARTNAMASLMKQGAMGIQMAAAPSGSYTYRY